MTSIKRGCIIQLMERKADKTKLDKRRGGLKGGPARAATLTPERRREIAQQAAYARWSAGRAYMADL